MYNRYLPTYNKYQCLTFCMSICSALRNDQYHWQIYLIADVAASNLGQ